MLGRKQRSGTGKSSLVLEVPLRYLRPSIIYSVPSVPDRAKGLLNNSLDMKVVFNLYNVT